MSNASSPAEKTEPKPLLLSPEETKTKEMETTHETIPPGWRSRLKARARRHAVPSAVLNIICLPLLFIIIIVLIVLYAMHHKPCPEGWVGYLGKCYYFSKLKADWPSSQSNCFALGASLAVIDTQQEMDFLRRNRGPAGYWIGLRRDPDQPWKWTSGTEFNRWFTVEGAETCAFMTDNDISSSSCSKKQRWICSK